MNLSQTFFFKLYFQAIRHIFPVWNAPFSRKHGWFAKMTIFYNGFSRKRNISPTFTARIASLPLKQNCGCIMRQIKLKVKCMSAFRSKGISLVRKYKHKIVYIFVLRNRRFECTCTLEKHEYRVERFAWRLSSNKTGFYRNQRTIAWLPPFASIILYFAYKLMSWFPLVTWTAMFGHG